MAGDRLVVLGGGVVGLSLARDLAGRGARVLLLEARGSGAGASSAAVGVLVPAPGRSALAELSRQGYDLYPTLARELREEMGIDIGYRECGSVTLVGAHHRPERQLRSRRETGREVAWLERRELERRIPGYGGHSDTGLWVAREAVVHPPSLLEALRRSSRARDVTVGESCGELSVIAGASPCRVTVECGAESSAASLLSGFSDAGVIVAAGAWAACALAKLSGARVAVEPVRGQALELRHPAPESIVHFQPEPAGKSYFLVPRDENRVWVGSTVEEAGFDDRTTREGLEELLAAARWVLPTVDESDVTEVWSGLRPRAMRRGGPFLGPWPGVTNLWVACGHYRSGILQGPVSARLLCDHIFHDAPLPEEFSLLPAV